MQSLATMRSQVRVRLDEVTARFWADSDLTTWVNEGAREIARIAQNLPALDQTQNAVVGTSKYNFPANMLRAHRIEFVVANQTYPLKAATRQEMDQYWGYDQTTQGSYPSYFIVDGFPPTATFQVYPVPSQVGVFNIYYYRLPLTAAADGDLVEIPQGWEDMVSDYCEYRALRKDRDPAWKDAKQIFDERLEKIINATREYHDQSQSIIMAGGPVPAWLYSFDE